MKERIVVDVIFTEDGGEIYRIVKADEHLANPVSADGLEAGYFKDSDEVDAWLEENADSVEVVTDYRNE